MSTRRGRPPRQPVQLDQLPNRLREHREAKGWSLEQLAEKTGHKAQTVARHETVPGQMTLGQMERYATILGVRPEEMLADGVRISRRLRQLLAFAETLSEGELDRLMRLGHALAEPPAPFVTKDDKAA
jgi:transcriptional regulator with XRE-family HTH domain